MRNTYLFGTLLLYCLLMNTTQAQDNSAFFENGAAYVNSSNGPGYISPLINVMNNGVHAGLFPATDLRDSFYIYFGINSNVSFIPDKLKQFEGNTLSPFSPTTAASVPTIFGANESTILEDEEGWAYIFPGGLAFERFYVGTPQISIGGVANTSLTLRFLGFSFNEDIGKFKIFGLGVQHDLSPYLALEKFKLTGEFAFHQIKTGDWLTSNHLLIRSSIMQRSEQSRWYGFLGYQQGTMELTNIEEEINTKIKSDNKLLIGAGAAIDLAFLNIGLEASYSSTFTINANIGLKFQK